MVSGPVKFKILSKPLIFSICLQPSPPLTWTKSILFGLLICTCLYSHRTFPPRQPSTVLHRNTALIFLKHEPEHIVLILRSCSGTSPCTGLGGGHLDCVRHTCPAPPSLHLSLQPSSPISFRCRSPPAPGLLSKASMPV